jgi:hypothetical protein
MADTKKSHESRRASNAMVSAGLSSEDDAAVLGMLLNIKIMSFSDIANETNSKAWLQARASAKLYALRGLWYSFLYYGFVAFDRKHTSLLNSCRPSRFVSSKHNINLSQSRYIYLVLLLI